MTLHDVIYPVGVPFTWKVTVRTKNKETLSKYPYYELPEWALKAKVLKVNSISLLNQEIDVTLE